MAGLDGIKNKIDPGEPLERTSTSSSRREAKKIKSTPGSLGEVLDRSGKGPRLPAQGDVFTQDLIETWISYKREKELAPVNLRPVPYEFFLYYDL